MVAIEHTPLPWAANGRQPTRICVPGRRGFNGGDYRVADAHHSSVGLVNTPSHREAVANAAFIVRAANSHFELLAQLEFAVKLLHPFGTTAQVDAMKAAIAKARGIALAKQEGLS